MNIQTEVDGQVINVISIKGNGTDVYVNYIIDGELRTKKMKGLTHTGEIIIGNNSQIQG